jgi:hypothetical protein
VSTAAAATASAASRGALLAAYVSVVGERMSVGWGVGQVDSRLVHAVMSLCDVLTCVLFLWTAAWLKRAVAAGVAVQDARNITAGDFTVLVWGLPKDADKGAVISHFSANSALDREHAVWPHWCGCFGRPDEATAKVKRMLGMGAADGADERRPVRNLEHADGDERYRGSWVASVSLAHPSGAAIRSYLANRRLRERMGQARATVRKYSRRTKRAAGPDKGLRRAARARVDALARRVNAVNARLMKLDLSRRHEEREKEVVCAFVTFNHAESFARCVDDYRTSGYRSGGGVSWSAPCRRRLQPRELRFQQRHGLTVGPAPDPDDLIWENLEHGVGERRARRALSAAVAVALLLVSFLGLLAAQLAQRRLHAGKLGELGACDELPAVLHGGFGAAYGWTDRAVRPRRFAQHDGACMAGAAAAKRAAAGGGHGATVRGDGRWVGASEHLNFVALPAVEAEFANATRRNAPSSFVYRDPAAAATSSPYLQSPLSFEWLLNARIAWASPPPPPHPANATFAPLNYTRAGARSRMDAAGNANANACPASGALCSGACFTDAGEAVRADGVVLIEGGAHEPVVVAAGGAAAAPAPAPRRRCCKLQCFVREQDSWDGLEGCASFAPTLPLSCFCEAAVGEASKTYGSVLGPLALMWGFGKGGKEPLCASFAKQWLAASASRGGSSLAVVLVNVLLELVMGKLTRFERHHSRSQEASAVVGKVFVAQFLNTALIVLLISGRLPGGKLSLGLESWGILNGDFVDFDRRWYYEVGAAISLTMVVNSLVPLLMSAAELVGDALRRRRALRLLAADARMGADAGRRLDTPATQRALDEAVRGPSFDIEARFPLFLNSAFCTLLFCSGLPLLLPVAAASFGVSYAVDKCMLLRVYRRPFYTEALSAQAISLLPWAVVLHLPVAVWVFGSPSLVRADPMSMEGARALGATLTKRLGWGGGDGPSAGAAELDARAAEAGSALAFLSAFDPLEPVGGFAWRAARLTGGLPLLLLLALACWHAFRHTAGRLLRWVKKKVVQCATCDFGTFEHRLAEKEDVPFSAYTEPFEQCALHPLRPGRLLKQRGDAAQEALGWAIEGRAVLAKDVEKIRKRKLQLEQGGEGGCAHGGGGGGAAAADGTTSDDDDEEDEGESAGYFKDLMSIGGGHEDEDEGASKWQKDAAARAKRERRDRLNARQRAEADNAEHGPPMLHRRWLTDGHHAAPAAADARAPLRFAHLAGEPMRTWQAMSTLPSYALLANPKYAEALAYMPPHRRSSVADDLAQTGGKRPSMDWGAASSVLSKTTVADPAQVLQETRVARALMTLLELLIVHSQTLFLLFVLAPAPADRGPLASRHARLTDDGVALAEHASANATATALDGGGGQWRWGWLVRMVAPLATALYADGTSVLGALPLHEMRLAALLAMLCAPPLFAAALLRLDTIKSYAAPLCTEYALTATEKLEEATVWAGYMLSYLGCGLDLEKEGDDLKPRLRRSARFCAAAALLVVLPLPLFVLNLFLLHAEWLYFFSLGCGCLGAALVASATALRALDPRAARRTAQYEWRARQAARARKERRRRLRGDPPKMPAKSTAAAAGQDVRHDRLVEIAKRHQTFTVAEVARWVDCFVTKHPRDGDGDSGGGGGGEHEGDEGAAAKAQRLAAQLSRPSARRRSAHRRWALAIGALSYAAHAFPGAGAGFLLAVLGGWAAVQLALWAARRASVLYFNQVEMYEHSAEVLKTLARARAQLCTLALLALLVPLLVTAWKGGASYLFFDAGIFGTGDGLGAAPPAALLGPEDGRGFNATFLDQYLGARHTGLLEKAAGTARRSRPFGAWRVQRGYSVQQGKHGWYSSGGGAAAVRNRTQWFGRSDNLGLRQGLHCYRLVLRANASLLPPYPGIPNASSPGDANFNVTDGALAWKMYWGWYLATTTALHEGAAWRALTPAELAAAAAGERAGPLGAKLGERGYGPYGDNAQDGVAGGPFEGAMFETSAVILCDDPSAALAMCFGFVAAPLALLLPLLLCVYARASAARTGLARPALRRAHAEAHEDAEAHAEALSLARAEHAAAAEAHANERYGEPAHARDWYFLVFHVLTHSSSTCHCTRYGEPAHARDEARADALALRCVEARAALDALRGPVLCGREYGRMVEEAEMRHAPLVGARGDPRDAALEAEAARIARAMELRARLGVGGSEEGGGANAWHHRNADTQKKGGGGGGGGGGGDDAEAAREMGVAQLLQRSRRGAYAQLERWVLSWTGVRHRASRDGEEELWHWDTSGAFPLFRPYRLACQNWKAWQLGHRMLTALALLALGSAGSAAAPPALVAFVAGASEGLALLATLLARPYASAALTVAELALHASLAGVAAVATMCHLGWMDGEGFLAQVGVLGAVGGFWAVLVLAARPHILMRAAARARKQYKYGACNRVLFRAAKRRRLDIMQAWDAMVPAGHFHTNPRPLLLDFLDEDVERFARVHHVTVLDVLTPAGATLLHAATVNRDGAAAEWLLEADSARGSGRLSAVTAAQGVGLRPQTALEMCVTAQLQEWEQADAQLQGIGGGGGGGGGGAAAASLADEGGEDEGFEESDDEDAAAQLAKTLPQFKWKSQVDAVQAVAADRANLQTSAAVAAKLRANELERLVAQQEEATTAARRRRAAARIAREASKAGADAEAAEAERAAKRQEDGGTAGWVSPAKRTREASEAARREEEKAAAEQLELEMEVEALRTAAAKREAEHRAKLPALERMLLAHTRAALPYAMANAKALTMWAGNAWLTNRGESMLVLEALEAPMRVATAVDLRGVPLGDAGAALLARVLGAPRCRLRSLDVSGEAVGLTRAGKEQLARALLGRKASDPGELTDLSVREWAIRSGSTALALRGRDLCAQDALLMAGVLRHPPAWVQEQHARLERSRLRELLKKEAVTAVGAETAAAAAAAAAAVTAAAKEEGEEGGKGRDAGAEARRRWRGAGSKVARAVHGDSAAKHGGFAGAAEEAAAHARAPHRAGRVAHAHRLRLAGGAGAAAGDVQRRSRLRAHVAGPLCHVPAAGRAAERGATAHGRQRRPRAARQGGARGGAAPEGCRGGDRLSRQGRCRGRPQARQGGAPRARRAQGGGGAKKAAAAGSGCGARGARQAGARVRARHAHVARPRREPHAPRRPRAGAGRARVQRRAHLPGRGAQPAGRKAPDNDGAAARRAVRAAAHCARQHGAAEPVARQQ